MSSSRHELYVCVLEGNLRKGKGAKEEFSLLPWLKNKNPFFAFMEAALAFLWLKLILV
jgi:hypothetical protein